MTYDADGLPISDRTRETERRYQDDRAAGRTKRLVDEPCLRCADTDQCVWHLKENRYPYDARWEKCQMLVFWRECSWQDLSDDELLDLAVRIASLTTTVDEIKINGTAMQSVRTVPHVHLLSGRRPA